MAIDVTCELTATNTTNSDRKAVVYFQLDTSGEYFRHEGLVEIQSSTTLTHTFYNVDETITHVIYAYDINFVLIDTHVLDNAIYGELTTTLDSTTIHCSFPVNNTSTATLSISIFFSLNSSDAIRYIHSIAPESSYTFTHDFTSINIYEDNIIYVRDSEFNELDSVTIPGLSPGDIFTYSGFTAVYADDIDYNDVISCSLTATNNSAIAQNCIIYFKLGDYLVQQTYTIPSSSSYTFTYNFENIDIFQENIVTVFNSANQLIDSVTIPAYPEFEMYFEASLGNMIVQITLSANDFCDIFYGDGTSDNIITAGNYNQYSSVYLHEYTTVGLKKITFTDARRLQMFYISYLNTKTYSSYYISDISQLRNLHYFGIFMGSGGISFNENITFTPSAFAKATKNTDNIVLSTLKGFVNDLCFSRKIYTNIALRFAYNFNVSANKLATIMYYCKSFRIYSASVDETPYTNRTININSLILTPYITSYFLFSYCNCPNIDRNSNFGNGYTYLFQASNLTSEAVDNAIYVVRNTNNYTGTGAKSLNLSSNSRRTHASDADLAILLSRGWVVTVSEPL